MQFMKDFFGDKRYDAHPEADAVEPKGNSELLKPEGRFDTLKRLKDAKLLKR